MLLSILFTPTVGPEIKLLVSTEEMVTVFEPDRIEIEPEPTRDLKFKSTPTFWAKKPSPEPIFEAVVISPEDPVDIGEPLRVKLPEIATFPESELVLGLNLLLNVILFFLVV